MKHGLFKQPISFIHASRRSQFAPVIVFKSNLDCRRILFVKIFHGEAARKISTKRFGKCGRQDKFDFPLMRGKTVSQTNLSGNSVQAHSLVKGRAADSQQGRCLCQVSFRDGKSRLDLLYVSSFIFLQTLVYLLFPHGVRNGLSRILEP